MFIVHQTGGFLGIPIQVSNMAKLFEEKKITCWNKCRHILNIYIDYTLNTFTFCLSSLIKMMFRYTMCLDSVDKN